MWRCYARDSISRTAASTRLRGNPSRSPCLGASIRAFAFATAKRRDTAEFQLLVPALRRFHEQFGHFLVPYSFPIAGDDVQWPEEARGINIGRRLDALMTNPRHRKHHVGVLEQLDRLGFPVNVDWKRHLWEKRTLAALKTFYSIHGHSVVPVAFVVPKMTEEWPRETWGHELGKRVAKIREQRDRLTEPEQQDLEHVKFSFDVDDTQWCEKVLPALKAFLEEHGHGFVKRDFVVPPQGPYPKESWGLRLGLVAHNIRCHGAYREQVERDRDLLPQEAWIHLVGSPEDEWNVVILPAIRAYCEQFGHGSVPATFVVPTSDPWPQAARGFSLGQLVHTSHSLEIYKSQLERDRELLNQLGVHWFASLDDRWKQQIFPSLQVYAKTFGTASPMPQRFVVPSEKPWPEAAWGLRLGEMVSRMRTRDHFSAQRERNAQVLQAEGIDRVINPRSNGSTQATA